MNEELREQIVKLIKDNLAIDVKTESVYIGDLMGGNPLYKESHTITLEFNGEVLSVIYI